jgi:hypothetical protein
MYSVPVSVSLSATERTEPKRFDLMFDINVRGTFMVTRYAKSYIDRLYQAKDVFALHGVACVVGKHRELPEQFSLFLRLWEWCCSTRSGSWQYYEGISARDFETTAQALERFGLRELAERYRSGMSTWKEPRRCGDLDRWIDSHWRELEATAFRLIADDRNCLYDES